MTPERVDPPYVGGEAELLLGFLDWHRATLVGQCSGLDDEQLRARLEPSAMTLGGLLTHLAYVEDYWFGFLLAGDPPAEPWRSADWEVDDDADWHLGLPGTEAQRLLAESVDRAHEVTARLLSGPDGLDALSAGTRGGEHVSLRYVLVHMLEEYARHNGHADLLREAIDGTVGE